MLERLQDPEHQVAASSFRAWYSSGTRESGVGHAGHCLGCRRSLRDSSYPPAVVA